MSRRGRGSSNDAEIPGCIIFLLVVILLMPIVGGFLIFSNNEDDRAIGWVLLIVGIIIWVIAACH